MLYDLRETVFRAWEPWRELAASTATALRTEDAEVGTPRRSLLATLEFAERMSRNYEKPAFGLDSTIVDGEEVAVRERHVYSKPFATLIHFERDVASSDPRVLLLPPLSGHYSTLIRGTVEALLPQHDVYVADWTNARDVPVEAGCFDLDDYIDYVIEMIEFLGPGTHVLGICQAAVPALAAVAIMEADRHPTPPTTLTVMAGPIDARVSPTEVNDFAVKHPMEFFESIMVDRVPANHPGAGREVYPGFVQLTAFLSMNPGRHADAFLRFYEDVLSGDEAPADAHRLFYDEYMAVMDMTAEFYVQTVKSVFQDFDLAKDQMVSRERPVDPSKITRVALMTVEGERDDICGIGQTEAAHRLASALPDTMRRHLLQPGVGHYGVFSGRRWRNEIMPEVRDFIRTHDRRD